jgi:transcriptional regulator with XRE-family HTH domain
MPESHDPKVQFGKTLRVIRERVGISQGELSRIAKIDRTYISDVERGLRNVSLENIVRLATALGVSPADLMRDV